MINNVWSAFFITFAVALAWLRLNDWIAHKGWVSGRLSRKFIHIGTGPIFVLCWLLFPNIGSSRYLAALIPLAITAQFFLVGFGVIKDQAAVDAMTRTGDRKEILRGPLIYGIVFVLLTIVYWKTSFIGIIALMLLSGGDGLADILGSRIRSHALPWSKGKTVVGSVSMFLGGLVTIMIVLIAYSLLNALPLKLIAYVIPVVVISVIGTIVESLPIHDWDNLTVPVAAILIGHLLF